MTISDDLFRAVLALDAYNRGYNSSKRSPDAAQRKSGLTARLAGFYPQDNVLELAA